MLLMFHATGCKKLRKASGIESTDGKSTNTADKEFELTKRYIKMCEDALGPIPKFDCNAEGSLMLPVLVEGKRLEDASREIVTCDNPTMANFNGRCAVGSRYWSTTKSNTTWALFCINVQPKLGAFADGNHFDNIAILGTNSNGETCYFSSKNVEAHGLGERPPIDSRSLPKISSAVSSLADYEVFSTVYDLQKDVCVQCHQAAPWIRTPKFSMRSNGISESILPIVRSTDAYSVIGSELLNAAYREKKAESRDSVTIYQTLDFGTEQSPKVPGPLIENDSPWSPMHWSFNKTFTGTANYCVTCHRLGPRLFTPEIESPHLVLSALGGPFWFEKKEVGGKIVVKDPSLSAKFQVGESSNWHFRLNDKFFAGFKGNVNSLGSAQTKFLESAERLKNCLLKKDPWSDICGSFIIGNIAGSRKRDEAK